ncbi:GNAT family N-acetyltransferase [Streptomyces qinglanensis]|uniref:GNAT family N-acetyltransferase n=1 Tax=Streptomyces qinglanensis TaxID=943816 RepID=UPI003D737E18
MRASVHEISLTQRYLWRSTRESIPVQRAVVVELEQDGASGFGEASAFMTAHYNSGLDRMHADLRRIAPLLAESDAEDPYAVWRRLARELPASPFVLAAVDGAVHDLRARLLGVPLWRALDLPRPTGVRSSYSIGLDDVPVMVRKLRERSGWAAYKVKLADPGDLTVLKELREHTGAPFYVDGNCGWEPSRLLPALPRLAELGVELIEQPFPRDDWAAAAELKRASPVPVIADESITSFADLERCADAFHGINVKPMKAGGLTPALRLLTSARDRGLVTMLGCMPESAAGVSATAHLGGLVDHLDVDVVELLAVDTGAGLTLDGTGRVGLPDRPGSGYLPDPDAHGWTVRPADAGTARALWRTAGDPRPTGSAGPADLAEPGDGPGAWQLAALRAGRPVGALWMDRREPPRALPAGSVPPRGPLWRLGGVVVRAGERGTGAGGALLRTGLTRAALTGAGGVWCHAPAGAVALLRRYGFTAAPDAAAPDPAAPDPAADGGAASGTRHLMYWSPA